jgi:hypothetical protein
MLSHDVQHVASAAISATAAGASCVSPASLGVPGGDDRLVLCGHRVEGDKLLVPSAVPQSHVPAAAIQDFARYRDGWRLGSVQAKVDVSSPTTPKTPPDRSP